MVEKSVINNKGKGTGQREVRPVWNNARRANHQNFSKMTHPHPKRNFVPTTVATKSGQVLVNAAKQNSTASTSTARPKVNTAAIRSNVNAKSSYFKSHFRKRRHYNQRSAAKTNTFSRKINTAKGKNVTTAGPKAVVNAAEGKKENAVKSSGSYTLKRFNYGNPQYTLHDQGIFNSGCSRHMTGNKSFLTKCQEIDGGFIAFGGSPKRGQITDFKLFDENQLLLKFSRQNNMTRKVEENMHVNFLENKPNVVGSGLEWLFDIDLLTKSMNYKPVSAGNQSNGDAGIHTDIHAGQASQEEAKVHEYILLPFISSNLPLSSTIPSSNVNAGDQPGDVNIDDIQGDVDEISRNDDVCQGNEIRIDSS
nr:ribonuclease H-like domain-containing protein [Tanacetum cinerariifolium]